MSRVAGALPLKQVVSLVPESLTPLKPVVYWWYLRWFPRPWEQWGLVIEYALDWWQTGGSQVKGILCIYGPTQELASGILVAMAEGSQESPNFLDLSFTSARSTADERLKVTHRRSKKLFHTLEMKWGLLSDTISSGIPKYWKIFWKSSSVDSIIVGKPLRGIRQQDLENWTTTANTRVTRVLWQVSDKVHSLVWQGTLRNGRQVSDKVHSLVWARGLSFPAHTPTPLSLSLSLCSASGWVELRFQLKHRCCFSNFTCKYSRNHSTAIVFILCVAYLILSDDYKSGFLCRLTSWKGELVM